MRLKTDEMEKDVSNLLYVLKIVAPLLAAIMVGNWFLSEVKKARSMGKPGYQAYLSIPGVLIILAILLPLILWIIKR